MKAIPKLAKTYNCVPCVQESKGHTEHKQKHRLEILLLSMLLSDKVTDIIGNHMKVIF